MKYIAGTFFQIPNKHCLDKLEPTQALLYMWLCFFSDQDGDCFPSIKTLAAKMGRCESYTRKILSKLLKSGLVTSEIRKRDDGSQSSNIYHISLSPEMVSPLTREGGDPLTEERPLTKPIRNENFPSENLAAEAAKLPSIPKIQANGFGSPAINSVLANLKKVLKLEDFKDTNTEQRRWGHLFVGLIAKIGGSAFDKRLKLFSGDKFKWQNRSSMRYLYRELKLEPEVSERDIEEAYHSRSSDLTFIKIYGETTFCELHNKFQDNLRSGI